MARKWSVFRLVKRYISTRKVQRIGEIALVHHQDYENDIVLVFVNKNFRN